MKALLETKEKKRFVGTLLLQLGLGVLLFVSCARMDQQSSELSFEDSLFLFYALNQAWNGNCLHSYKAADNAGLLHCDRTNNAQCNYQEKYDESGRLFVTGSFRSLYSSEFAVYVDQYPVCKATAAVALASPFIKKTDPTKKSEIASKNVLLSIDQCESFIENDRSKLLNRSELVFALSPRGVMLRSAWELGETECYHNLLYSSFEQDLVQELKAGNRVLQSSCRYGTQASLLLPTYIDCTAAEKNSAASFDFAAF